MEFSLCSNMFVIVNCPEVRPLNATNPTPPHVYWCNHLKWVSDTFKRNVFLIYEVINRITKQFAVVNSPYVARWRFRTFKCFPHLMMWTFEVSKYFKRNVFLVDVVINCLTKYFLSLLMSNSLYVAIQPSEHVESQVGAGRHMHPNFWNTSMLG